MLRRTIFFSHLDGLSFCSSAPASAATWTTTPATDLPTPPIWTMTTTTLSPRTMEEGEGYTGVWAGAERGPGGRCFRCGNNLLGEYFVASWLLLMIVVAAAAVIVVVVAAAVIVVAVTTTDVAAIVFAVVATAVAGTVNSIFVPAAITRPNVLQCCNIFMHRTRTADVG